MASRTNAKPTRIARIDGPEPQEICSRNQAEDTMPISDHFAESSAEAGRYRSLVDAITDYAIYMLDPSGHVASWNRGAKRFKGYDEAEILGRHFAIFYTEEDQRDGLPARALEVAARTGTFEGEGWRARKDGSRFWAHVVIDPIRDDAGALVGFAKVTRDLSERQEARDALRRSEDQFRLLVQSVADYAIYLLDANGFVSSWNMGAERIKGYAPDEVIGRHFSLFFTEEDRAKGEPDRALAAAAMDGRFEKEAWRVRKNGDVFLANVVISPVRDDNGTLVGFAKVTRDMTAAKRAQLDLDRAREALLLAQKMEAVGQLTGGIAHDFNVIFRAILGGLETAYRSMPEDPDIVPHVENAMQAARRGRSLTQRMLALAERQELAPERVELPVLLQGMADLLQRTLGPSIAVEFRFPSALGAAHVDPNQLALVIVTLLRNARDAMPDGGTIVIAAHEAGAAPDQAVIAAPRRFIRLSVIDPGDGMDEDTVARATEPFFTTRGVGKGTGLGLSMAQSFAEQSGGQFVISSKSGEGTIAELWLPMAEEFAAGEHADRSRTDLAEIGDPLDQRAAGAGPLVILAVDDDRLGLMNTTSVLNKLGHRVYTALAGQQALDVLRREAGINLVIIDHALPDMTGAELADAVRLDFPLLPIIFATPLADACVQQVAKPFRDGDLSRAIARIAPANMRAMR
jgi:PAS domain S-box-containing protein